MQDYFTYDLSLVSKPNSGIITQNRFNFVSSSVHIKDWMIVECLISIKFYKSKYKLMVFKQFVIIMPNQSDDSLNNFKDKTKYSMPRLSWEQVASTPASQLNSTEALSFNIVAKLRFSIQHTSI